MATPIGSTQNISATVSLEKVSAATRKLNEQSVQRTEQNRQRMDNALSAMLDNQIQSQEQKVHVGRVLMNSDSLSGIGGIIDTTA